MRYEFTESNSPYSDVLAVEIPEGVNLPVRADVVKTVLGRTTTYRVVPDPSKPLVAVISGLVWPIIGQIVVVAVMDGRHSAGTVLYASPGAIVRARTGYKCRSESFLRITEEKIEHMNPAQVAELVGGESMSALLADQLRNLG